MTREFDWEGANNWYTEAFDKIRDEQVESRRQKLVKASGEFFREYRKENRREQKVFVSNHRSNDATA